MTSIHPRLRPALAVSLGAIPGALSRFLLAVYLEPYLVGNVPFATLIVNVTGCFLLGVIAPLAFARTFVVHPDLRLLLTTGLIGSYTTFSSYELDNDKLLGIRDMAAEGFYWLGSTGLGLLALELGSRLVLWGLASWEKWDDLT
ncbi:camphor resistance protein CrcB-like protein [Thermosynechococcus sp. NK55a]|uniref:fluoride efflux transporter CrcB n=1 Tax=unclassified Thermosynechococcus TaxID=2622553 RepID=UPI0003D91B4B|nr:MULTISPECIES: fluoride efflux transporter CrcB [unclassified Thermosynechococcus]AHB87627.1 camphor resistance protein CrcB-like protein [Thermosynechococcus sp. NK55a]